jgi:hypothetical protein
MPSRLEQGAGSINLPETARLFSPEVRWRWRSSSL